MTFSNCLSNILFLFLQYLGCVEVFESRGMEVCEEALKTLRVMYLHIYLPTYNKN